MLLTSLDLLVIVFMVLASVSLLALSLMFLVRNPRIKKVCFYIVALLGIYMGYVGFRIGSGLFPCCCRLSDRWFRQCLYDLSA